VRQKGAVKRGQNKTRLTTQNKVLDNNQTKTKNCHKNKQTTESTNLPKRDTKRGKSLRDLFRQLETLVQSHTETQLKLHHNGIKIYKPITRCPMNTKIHTLERQKRHYFRLQQYVDKYIASHFIRKMTTAPFLKETVYSWRTNGTRMVQRAVKGAVTISPTPLSSPTLLALNSHKSNSFISHKQQHKPKRCLAHTQLGAVHDFQADILSTLKEASYSTNDTTRAHINSLHIDSFNKLKYREKKMKVRC
jgi:hypothetical protein